MNPDGNCPHCDKQTVNDECCDECRIGLKRKPVAGQCLSCWYREQMIDLEMKLRKNPKSKVFQRKYKRLVEEFSENFPDMDERPE